MDRQALVVGNWKMQLSYKGELELARSLKNLLRGVMVTAEVVVCPSYPSLMAVEEMFKNSEKIAVGAQGVHREEKGAYTGQVSVLQIAPLVRWCLAGHSEQRAAYDLTDSDVTAQVSLILKHGLTPIICVGETAAERAAEQTVARVTEQVTSLLQKLTRASFSKLVIAYEPIWAIGSGQQPESNDVSAILLLIRKLISERFDRPASDRVRLLYGGSVTPETAAAVISEPGVDGLLVGEAATHPNQLVEIIRITQELARQYGGSAETADN